MPTLFGRVLAVALLLLAPASEAASLLASVQPRILHGTPTTAFPEVCGVGVRRSDGKLGLCSGTLIAPTVVLTAAHCLAEVVQAGAVCLPDGARLEVFASDWVAHPEYRWQAHADIGLVFLEEPMVGIVPATLPRARPTNRRGELVGFGVDGNDDTNVKRMGGIKLMKRCPRKARRRVGLLRDALRSSLCWKPKPGGIDACIGDSGGPLFVDGEVVGVTSAAITASLVGCPGKLSWSTDVSTFRGWIDAEMALRGVP